MELIVTAILALIPSAAIIIAVHLFLKKQLTREVSQVTHDLKKERQAYFLGPRLEAYQRVILLMERINPHSLIMRTFNPKSSAKEFQSSLLSSIRNEFDHNVAQQMFISVQGWEMVKKSKEETVKIINLAAKQLEKDASATDLSTKIFELIAEIGELPTDITVNQLKQEFQKLF
jgi:hypothetical protein